MSYLRQSPQEDRNFVSRICDIAILSMLQILVVFLPLLFLVQNEEIFEFNKMIFVYIVASLIITAWAVKTVVEKKLTFKRTPFDWFIIFFLFSQLISTVLSIHPRTSLFGYYTRFHGGLFSTVSYFILFFATTTFIKKRHVPGFVGVTLIGAFLAALYAFPEHFGHSPSCLLLTNTFNASCWIQDVQNRVFGTFGQPNWLAAYLILLLPLGMTLGLFDAQKVKPQVARLKLGATVVSGVLTFLFFATLLFTKSRSGVLGFGVSLVIFILLMMFQLFKKTLSTSRFPKLLIFGGTLTLLLMTGLVFGTPYSPTLSQFISQKNQLVEQPSTQPVAVDRLEVGGTDSGDIRRIVWKGAIKVWKRYPLFGSGVETFAYSYYLDRPMEHNTVSEWDFLYNKAHNEELNFLATTGVFGLATYGILQAIIGWFLFKEAFFGKDRNTALLATAVLTGLIDLHISNFLGFSTVVVTVLMYVLPALVIAQISDEQHIEWQLFSLKPASAIHEPLLSFIGINLKKISTKMFGVRNSSEKVTAGQWVLVSIASMIGIFMVVQISMIWFADHYYSKAKDAYTNNDFETALSRLKIAIELSPREGLYYELYSKVASQYAIALLQENKNELGTQFANSALEASTTSIKLNPVHINFYKTRNQVLVTLAQAKPELYDAALETLHVAEQLSPTDPKLVYYSALVENAQGNTKQTQKDLYTAIEMKPNYDSARYMLGQLLEIDKNYGGAKEQYQYILENIAPNNETVQKRLDAVATFSAKKK
ncbi:MAG: O-antigen ligase family protein [Patescibacteria group bacterium]